MKSRFTRKLLLAAASAIALSTALAACSSNTGGTSGGGSSPQLRIVTNNTIASLPVVVAQQEGFFKDEGLTANLTTVADITKIPPTLGKQYDIGFGVQPALIRAASQGLPLAMISGNAITSTKDQQYVIMTRPNSGISTPASFNGKKLGTPTLNGNIHIGTLYWLQQNGVDPKSVTSLQVPTPVMVDQLKAGLIDAAEMQQPFIDIAKKAGMVQAAYALSAVGDPAYMSGWLATRPWAEKNPAAVTKFRAALDKANAWITANQAAARQMLSKFTKTDPSVLGDTPISAFTTDLSVESVQQWDAPMRAVAGFTGKVDYNKLVVLK